MGAKALRQLTAALLALPLEAALPAVRLGLPEDQRLPLLLHAGGLLLLMPRLPLQGLPVGKLRLDVQEGLTQGLPLLSDII